MMWCWGGQLCKKRYKSLCLLTIWILSPDLLESSDRPIPTRASPPIHWCGEGVVLRIIDSSYGELKLELPNTYFIDSRQMQANLQKILIKSIKNNKMHVHTFQGRHFLKRNSPCGTLHNITKSLVPLFAAICR